jgi:CRP/FNR family cyclic AMP-dependent transcriptional regulator
MPEETAVKLENFFQTGTLYRFQKGELILQAEEEPQGIYFIEHGHVKIYSIRNSGESNMHIIYKGGELFPLIWAYRGKNLSVFYEAMDDVTVHRVGRQEFKDFSRQHLDISNLMQDYLATVFWIYANRVENLGLSRARDRVIYRLLFLIDRFGVKNQLGEVLIDLPITQQDMADSLKMIRETASREIEKLESQDIIAYRNHRIVILQPEKLRQELNNAKQEAK